MAQQPDLKAITALKRAAEDAIAAANPRYAAFADVALNPLLILELCAQVERLQAAPELLSLDLDPLGIRARASDAITGALAFGAQGVNPPPDGHWLTPFWEMAKAERAQQAAHAPVESEADYRRGYRDGYNRRDDEVKGCLV